MVATLFAQSAVSLLLSSGASCGPSTIPSRVSPVRMSGPAMVSEEAAKAAWLAKNKPGWNKGSVAPVRSNIAAPVAASPANDHDFNMRGFHNLPAQEMTCAWATDALSAPKPKQYKPVRTAPAASNIAALKPKPLDEPGTNDHDFNMRGQVDLTSQEMTCAWATEASSAPKPKQYKPAAAAPTGPSKIAALVPKPLDEPGTNDHDFNMRGQVDLTSQEMTCAWATEASSAPKPKQYKPAAAAPPKPSKAARGGGSVAPVLSCGWATEALGGAWANAEESGPGPTC